MRDDQHDVACHHGCLGYHEHSCTAKAGLEHVSKRSSADKTNCVGHENERDDCIADVVVSLHRRDQCARSAVLEAVGEAHAAATKQPPFVHRRVRKCLDNISCLVGARAWRSAHFQLIGRFRSLGTAMC